MIPSFITSLILFIPAFIANPSAVLTGGKFVIDRGKSWRGKRIFGDHKTWSGFIGGVATGILSGIIINYVFAFAGINELTFSSNVSLVILMVTVLSFFSMLGDLIGSFIKRRLGKEAGSESLFLDQYPFALTALGFFYLIFYPESISIFTWEGCISILVVTPLIHRAVNIIGYKIKVKSVPY
ncbi:MAG: CDP-2,3-bis-(O-geranylgeranyl)-sn-glycerol synthase [Thermoplasmatales archaeon]